MNPLATPPASAPTAIASVSAVRAVADSASVPNRTRLTKTGPPITAVASVYPVRRLTRFAEANARSANSRMSMSGERPWSWSQTNPAPAAAESSTPPMTSGSVQPRSPVTVIAPMPATSATLSSSAPGKSSRPGVRGVSMPPAKT